MPEGVACADLPSRCSCRIVGRNHGTNPRVSIEDFCFGETERLTVNEALQCPPQDEEELKGGCASGCASGGSAGVRPGGADSSSVTRASLYGPERTSCLCVNTAP